VFAVGNHDGESVNSDYANTTLYSIGYDFKNKGSQYYYFDNDGLKIRFIVLANPDNDYYGLSKTQLEWLANDALNTNYDVVCAMHINVNSNMYNLDRLADILNAYCDKTAGSGTVYGGAVHNFDPAKAKTDEPWMTGGVGSFVADGYSSVKDENNIYVVKKQINNRNTIPKR
jgi:hypothetical protein